MESAVAEQYPLVEYWLRFSFIRHCLSNQSSSSAVAVSVSLPSLIIVVFVVVKNCEDKSKGWHLEAAKSAAYTIIHIFASVFDDQMALGSCKIGRLRNNTYVCQRF